MNENDNELQATLSKFNETLADFLSDINIPDEWKESLTGQNFSLEFYILPVGKKGQL